MKRIHRNLCGGDGRCVPFDRVSTQFPVCSIELWRERRKGEWVRALRSYERCHGIGDIFRFVAFIFPRRRKFDLHMTYKCAVKSCKCWKCHKSRSNRHVVFIRTTAHKQCGFCNFIIWFCIICLPFCWIFLRIYFCRSFHFVPLVLVYSNLNNSLAFIDLNEFSKSPKLMHLNASIVNKIHSLNKLIRYLSNIRSADSIHGLYFQTKINTKPKNGTRERERKAGKYWAE